MQMQTKLNNFASKETLKKILDGQPSKDQIENFIAVQELCFELMKAKSVKYGKSWRKRELIGACLNLERKLDRFNNELTKMMRDGEAAYMNPENIGADDGIMDQLMDMVNYATLIMTYLIEKDMASSFVEDKIEYIGNELKYNKGGSNNE